jgi:hypothetical protein
VLPQLAAPASLHVPLGSGPPFGTAEQVPTVPASEQDMQTPEQAVAQQTPCAQCPFRHSTSVEQTAPSSLSPQEPLMQTAGDTQSALAVQPVLQTAVPHRNGAQDDPAGVTHLPAPSQVEVGVKAVVPVGQLEPLHCVPAAYLWQAPAAHLPLLPQLALP